MFNNSVAVAPVLWRALVSDRSASLLEPGVLQEAAVSSEIQEGLSCRSLNICFSLSNYRHVLLLLVTHAPTHTCAGAQGLFTSVFHQYQLPCCRGSLLLSQNLVLSLICVNSLMLERHLVSIPVKWDSDDVLESPRLSLQSSGRFSLPCSSSSSLPLRLFLSIGSIGRSSTTSSQAA